MVQPIFNKSLSETIGWHKIIKVFRDFINFLKKKSLNFFVCFRLFPPNMKIGKSYEKVLIVSSWKMGSTLLTDLLGSHPLAFVLYEPLWHFGIERLRNKNSTDYKKQIGLIRDLLNCNFSSFRRM